MASTAWTRDVIDSVVGDGIDSVDWRSMSTVRIGDRRR